MNLYEELQKIKDFRRGQGQLHKLPIVLIIVIMANMSGYFGQRAIGDFIKKHKEELIEIFKPKRNLLPSYQTVARVLENIDFQGFTDIFHKWAIKYVEIEDKEWLSLDGKVIGGTVTNANNAKQKYTNLVTIFSNKRKQALSAGLVGKDKKSEIPVVKSLIKQLDLEGVIFTMDALHCQKDTTQTIIETKNDYVIGVKGNQKKLFEQIKKT